MVQFATHQNTYYPPCSDAPSFRFFIGFHCAAQSAKKCLAIQALGSSRVCYLCGPTLTPITPAAGLCQAGKWPFNVGLS